MDAMMGRRWNGAYCRIGCAWVTGTGGPCQTSASRSAGNKRCRVTEEETQKRPPNLMMPSSEHAFFRRKKKSTGGAPPVPPEDQSGFGGHRKPVCDRCVQDAVYEVTLDESLKQRLFFCAHHFRKHFGELARWPWRAL